MSSTTTDPAGSAGGVVLRWLDATSDTDVALWRDVRLAMLLDTPGAFGSRYADHLGLDLERWRENVASPVMSTLVAVEGGAPVGAAVFRRGDAVWVVFDTAARMDMSGAKALGSAKNAQWAAGPGYTALRIAEPEGLGVSAQGQGGTWTVTLGGPDGAAGGVEVGRSDDGAPVLVAQMAGATKAVWLTDPLVGDRFAAVTALAPGKGYAGGRRTVDLSLIPTAQGLAVETAADDLKIEAAGDLVTLSRPKGLTLSSPAVGLETGDHNADAPKRAAYPALIDEAWAATGEAGFSDRYRRLQDAAGLETISAPHMRSSWRRSSEVFSGITQTMR